LAVAIGVLGVKLDEAVAAAYGWPSSVAQDADEILRRLLAINEEIASGMRPYDPFGAERGGQLRLVAQ